jgi:hypothetical protein
MLKRPSSVPKSKLLVQKQLPTQDYLVFVAEREDLAENLFAPFQKTFEHKILVQVGLMSSWDAPVRIVRCYSVVHRRTCRH